MDEQQLQGVVSELVPLVERAAGRSFVSVPYGRMGTQADLERVLERENELVLSSIYPETPPWVREDMARAARGSAAHIVGKYGIETKVLYLAEDAISGLQARRGLSAQEARDAARLVLAHELAHALQDQVLDLLPVFVGQRDTDALEAFAAVTEGHANFVEYQVAADLGLTDLLSVLEESQGWTTAEGPKTRDAFPLWFRYGQGAAFVASLDQAGGSDAVWAALAHPPATTGMVLHPERYDPLATVSSEGVERFAGLEAGLGEGPWTITRTVLGEMELIPELWAVERSRRERVLEGLRVAAAYRAVRQDRQVEFRRLLFQSADAATAWMDMQQVASGERTGGLDIAVRVKDEVGPDGRRRVLRSVSMGEMTALEVHDASVVEGAEIVVVRTVGFRPGVRLGRALDQAVARVWGEGG